MLLFLCRKESIQWRAEKKEFITKVVPHRTATPYCHTVLPQDGSLVIVTYGERGYKQSPLDSGNREENRKIADRENEKIGQITIKQEKTMLAGALLGWKPFAGMEKIDTEDEPWDVLIVKDYAEVRKMKLAELNTKFFQAKFNLLLSGEQLAEYSEEARRLLYMDFRLDQRRVEFVFCMKKMTEGGCNQRNSLYNCVNCRNLCTGEKYLSHWLELLESQVLTVPGRRSNIKPSVRLKN